MPKVSVWLLKMNNAEKQTLKDIFIQVKDPGDDPLNACQAMDAISSAADDAGFVCEYCEFVTNMWSTQIGTHLMTLSDSDIAVLLRGPWLFTVDM